MSDSEEQAKMLAEMAKLGRAVVVNAPQLAQLGKRILGPFGETWGFLTDLTAHGRAVAMWRVRNRFKIYRLIGQKLHDANIDHEELSAVPERIAYIYEEGLEHEDEPTLQELWANLLVNATRPSCAVEPQKVFKDVLSGMETNDALLFQFLAGFPALTGFKFKDVHSRAGRLRVAFTHEIDTGLLDVLNMGSLESFIEQKLVPYIEASPIVERSEAELRTTAGNQTQITPIGQTTIFRWPPSQMRLTIDRVERLGLIAKVDVAVGVGRTHLRPKIEKHEEPISEIDARRRFGKANKLDYYEVTSLGFSFYSAVQDPLSNS